MPIYDFICEKCGKQSEVVTQMTGKPPECCGGVMNRLYDGSIGIRDSKSLTGKRRELWIERIDEIHKRQADRGERLRLPHPSEVL